MVDNTVLSNMWQVVDSRVNFVSSYNIITATVNIVPQLSTILLQGLFFYRFRLCNFVLLNVLRLNVLGAVRGPVLGLRGGSLPCGKTIIL